MRIRSGEYFYISVLNHALDSLLLQAHHILFKKHHMFEAGYNFEDIMAKVDVLFAITLVNFVLKLTAQLTSSFQFVQIVG